MHLSHSAALELIMGDSLNHKALGLSLVAALVTYTIAKKWPMSKAFQQIPMRPVKTKGPLGWLLGHQADDATNAYGSVGKFFMAVHGEAALERVAHLRVGRQSWIVSAHPADVHYIHMNESFVRPPLYKQMLGRMLGDSVACTLDNTKHKFHRRVMAPAFSPAALKAIADEVVPKHAGIFMEAIRTHAKDGKPFVVQKELYQATVQVMADAIFKTKDLKDTEEIVKVFEKALEGQWTWLRMIPGMDSLLFFRNKKVGDARAVLSQKTNKIMSEYRQSQEAGALALSTAKLTLMEHLIHVNELSEVELLDSGVTFMFAGQETSQTTLNWFCGFMARYPAVQAKLYEELCDAIGKNTQCRLDDLKSCKFLVNCIKESLRVRGVVGFAGRIALEDEVLPATKTFIPKGTQIFTSSWVPMHHPDIWGPDAEEYRPERWDNITTKQQRDLVELSWLPFSSGRHMCLGKDFAMNEILIIVAVLVRNFEVRFPAEDPEPVPIQFGSIHPKEPLRIVVVERAE